MKNKLVKSAFILIVASVFSKLLGAIYRVPLTNIIGTVGIGVYQLVFPVYSLLFVLCSNGVCLAISKMVASFRAKNDTKNISSVFKSGLIISLVVSIFFALCLVLGANIISSIQGNSQATLSYFSLGFSLIFASLVNVFRGLFQGFEDARQSAVAIILEQLFKLVFGLVLAKILMKYGVEYGVLGATIGVSAGELIAFIYLFIEYMIAKKKYKLYKTNINLKPVLKLALPITISTAILPLSSAVESFIVVPLLKRYMSETIATSLYGIQTGMINPLINFPLIIVTSLCTFLLPAVSFNESNKEKNKVMCEKAVKFTFIIIIASAFGYSILSRDILSLLYGKVLDKSLENISSLLFIVSSLVMLFSALSSIFTTILQANNKPYIAVKSLAISIVIKLILMAMLVNISSINILGLALSSLISFIVNAIINYLYVRKIYGIRIDLTALAKILSSVLVMVLSIFFIRLIFDELNLILSLIISIICGVVVYFMCLIIFNVISKDEIKSLLDKRVKVVAEKES